MQSLHGRTKLEIIYIATQIYFSPFCHPTPRWECGKYPCGVPTMRSLVFKLPHSVIVKSSGLLPMYYTVRELAIELGAVERTLRDWLSGGAPHIKDANGHIWVQGKDFSRWVDSVREPKQKQKRMKDNEGFCMHCKTTVDMLAISTRHIRGKLTMTSGTCSQCGRIIHRGGRIPSNPPAQQGVSSRNHD